MLFLLFYIRLSQYFFREKKNNCHVDNILVPIFEILKKKNVFIVIINLKNYY